MCEHTVILDSRVLQRGYIETIALIGDSECQSPRALAHPADFHFFRGVLVITMNNRIREGFGKSKFDLVKNPMRAREGL